MNLRLIRAVQTALENLERRSITQETTAAQTVDDAFRLAMACRRVLVAAVSDWINANGKLGDVDWINEAQNMKHAMFCIVSRLVDAT